MTSDRPYQPRVRTDEALAELRSAAGSQFDPDVVEVFWAVLAEGAIGRRGPEMTGASREPDGA